jgi:hypothetical protein
MKSFIVLVCLIGIVGFAFANEYLFVNYDNIERDIPLPLNPVFVKQIEDCGKIDLIDRASKNYNPRALVDGSLDECGN